ncbi:hypothetical protein HF650_11870 [Kosakonia sp. SMBL-WEM22]|uniref:hypothetical protein n=1 Tax=Kosakonia sp. SMBL-WEM22 TaxID=2725560 RepID=UPI00165A0BE7|nr:hypothetical protein [Kosakonia sp. SMBL-WEM22]QNQ20415.1 hypothetical protein HF650_11870 [Kosakonia sp. SMBL-WEM22]
MVITGLLRGAAKTLLFIVLLFIIGRLINSSAFITPDTAIAFAVWLHGSANQENYDDLWFFADVSLSLISAIIAYNVVITVVRKVMDRFPMKAGS